MTYTVDWSETDLGGSAVTSYGSGAILDFIDKPAGATAALSLTSHQADSTDNILLEVEVETSGSSTMTFDYKVSTESGWDKFHIDVDGVSQANYSGTVAWTTHSGISIPTAGTHTIRFRYNKDAGTAGNDDRVWIALLNITNTVTTNDAAGSVDTYDMEDGSIPSFVTTSTWTNSTSEPINGSRSLRSPATTAGSGSYDLEITKPAGSDYAAVGFDFKVSSEAGWDKLFVFPDASASNVPASGSPSTAGDAGWLEYSGSASGRLAIIMPAAETSMLLRYTKDGSGDGGSDAAWIDDVGMPASSSGAYDGTATSSSTATLTSAGVVGKVATAALAATVTIAAAGVVGTSTGASSTSTATITAAGAVGASSGASLAATATIDAAGTVTAAGTGSAALDATAALDAAGVVGTSSGAALAGTAALDATGVTGTSSSAALAGTASITAAGTVVAGGTGSAALAGTSSITATGVVGTSSGAELASSAFITAAGASGTGPNAGATLGATGELTAAGMVASYSVASITATAQLLADGQLGVGQGASLATTSTITATGMVAEAPGVTPDRRVYAVPAENRTYAVPAENRTLEA